MCPLFLVAMLVCAVTSGSALAFQSFEVDNYNATPNDPSDDDRAPIQSAIDDASIFALSGLPVTVNFTSGGTYHLNTDAQHPGVGVPACLNIVDQNIPGQGHITLDGHGAKLIVTDPTLRLFLIADSNQISVVNFEIDYLPLPYVDGTITSVNGSQFTMDIVRGEDDPAVFMAAPASSRWGWILDSSIAGMPKEGGKAHFQASLVTQSAPGTMSFDVNSGFDAAIFTVGSRITYHNRMTNNFNIVRSDYVTLRQITTYGAGAFFVNGNLNDSLVIEDCAARIAPGRWRSLNGDGIHLSGCTELTINRCVFEGISDDAINLKSNVDAGGTTGTSDFTITNCLFLSKRRHAIIFDANASGTLVSNGVIRDNVMAYNGGGFFWHKGGDYGSVEISNNQVLNNNLSITGNTSYLARIKSVHDGSLSLSVASAGGGTPSAGDSLVLGDFSYSNTLWDVIVCTDCDPQNLPQHLIQSRSARDADPLLYPDRWLYASGLGSTIQAPSGTLPGDEQKWEFVPVSGNIYYIRNLNSGLYLTVPSSPSAGDSATLELPSFDRTRHQWELQMMDG